MVNKKLGFEVKETSINIRKTYLNQIQNMDISLREFIDKAIGKELDIINGNDEWVTQEIRTYETRIDGLKTLLSERKKERSTLEIKDAQEQRFWINFQEYLKGNKSFRSESINVECGTNFPKGSLNEFQVIQEKYRKKEFTLTDFKELRKGKT